MQKAMPLILGLCLCMALCSCERGKGKEVAKPREFKPYEGVVVKSLPRTKYASIGTRDTVARLPFYQGKLIQWLVLTGTQVAGDFSALFFEPVPDNFRFDETRAFRYMVAVPVAERTLGSDNVKIYTADPCKAACFLHRGLYQEIGSSYVTVMGWVRANGCEPVYPVREVFIAGPGPNDPGDPSKYVTEIQVPIRPSGK